MQLPKGEMPTKQFWNSLFSNYVSDPRPKCTRDHRSHTYFTRVDRSHLSSDRREGDRRVIAQGSLGISGAFQSGDLFLGHSGSTKRGCVQRCHRGRQSVFHLRIKCKVSNKVKEKGGYGTTYRGVRGAPAELPHQTPVLDEAINSAAGAVAPAPRV